MTHQRFEQIKKHINDKLEYEPGYVSELVEHIEEGFKKEVVVHSEIPHGTIHSTTASIAIDNSPEKTSAVTPISTTLLHKEPNK